MGSGHVVVIGSLWIMRQGVRKLLKRIGLSVIVEGDDYEEACSKCDESIKPALVLIIVSQPDDLAEGLISLHAAAARFPEAKLILLAEGIDAAGTRAAMQLGANALLSPKLSSDLLGSSVQLVLLNLNLFPIPGPAAAARAAASAAAHSGAIAAEPPSPPPPRSERQAEPVAPRPSGALLNLVWDSAGQVATNTHRRASPSEREWEILQCLATGGSNKTIARQLGVAETTVKVHVKSLLRKLGVANRTQAAVWALNYGQRMAEPPLAEAARAAQAE